MKRYIDKITKQCPTCQHCKRDTKKKEELEMFDIPKTTGSMLAVDVAGPWKDIRGRKNYAILCVDHLLRKIFTKHSNKAPTSSLILKLIEDTKKETKADEGEILSDNGTTFRSQAWTEGTNQLNLKPRFCSLYYPQRDGISEVQYKR
jgi:Integrase core domain